MITIGVVLLLQTAAPPPRDLAGLIEPVVRHSRLPALGAAVVTADGLVAVGAAGVRSWSAAVPATAGDQWHIGSCTKTMTATLVARLVERGLLGWETTIGEVLGPDVHPAWKKVTVAWLLSHRSGAPLNFSEDLWERMVARGGSVPEQRRFFVTEGLKAAPAAAPNTETIYSNSAFLVAGVMLETLTGASWEDLMRREVFEPLGMTDTGFGAPGTPGQLDQPLGHTRGDSGWTPVALGPGADNPAATGPAGTVHTTLADWARFVAAHLRGERGDERFLRRATWRRLHRPGGRGWGYTPGWAVGERGSAGGTVLRHLGSNGFWVAEATLLPRRNLAVLLITNVGDDAAEAPFKELRAALLEDAAGRGR